MKRFIMTGAPGSGKTSILRALQALGYPVVEEAATDVIAAAQADGTDEPWRDPRFIERIVSLQRHRRLVPVNSRETAQIYDRSPVCTLALARYLGHPVTTALAQEVAAVSSGGLFDGRVFFIRPLGFCEPTSARRITYEQSLAFERVHEAEYLRLGFELVNIPAATVRERAAMIDACIR